MIGAKYSPKEYKAEKVGKKFKVDVLIHHSTTSTNPIEVTMWGNTEPEALQKMENFLKGINPL